jgi:lysophospholipase L1-like esterase
MKVFVKPLSLICIVLAIGQLISCSAGREMGIRRGTVHLEIPDSSYPSPDSIVATHNAWTRGHYPKRIKSFKSEPLQLHDIVFLGNSITEQGGDWGRRLNRPGIKNRGIAGDVTDGVLARLGEITYVKPKAVFIEIGINDLFNTTLNSERTATNIIRVAGSIKKQSPRTKVFVQTIFPTKNDFLISKIGKVNQILLDHKNPKLYTVLDTHALFADSVDLMKKELSKDGVHLNEKGYEVWVSYIRKFLR